MVKLELNSVLNCIITIIFNTDKQHLHTSERVWIIDLPLMLCIAGITHSCSVVSFD